MSLTEKGALKFIRMWNEKGMDGWSLISRTHFLTENFIIKYISKLNIDEIFIYQILSKEFKEKYKNFVSSDNRDNVYCFWCGTRNIIYYYKDKKGIKDRSKKMKRYCCYYCPKCLR